MKKKTPVTKSKEEIWKPISDCSSYSVSSEGNIRLDSTKENLLQVLDKTGYLKVQLYNDIGEQRFVWVHIVVAETFLSRPKYWLPCLKYADLFPPQGPY
ncbi:MAG: hypothetical protein Homavirus2_21 [Homavirus sp.]|uniref:NUMOD4 domain-containing protein n=1 Tax=Homavirus sp. TaxID=2487769 RepID=A0A3G5A474_9VIRU|nr:MAG: hypothetical protein Homavirus2_21 [Homavirus sp.]